MPEKDGSDDKKSTKSVVNKKQKQLMNKEQLDLTSVAESFGGKIVGEPVELDEFRTSSPSPVTATVSKVKLNKVKTGIPYLDAIITGGVAGWQTGKFLDKLITPRLNPLPKYKDLPQFKDIKKYKKDKDGVTKLYTKDELETKKKEQEASNTIKNFKPKEKEKKEIPIISPDKKKIINKPPVEVDKKTEFDPKGEGDKSKNIDKNKKKIVTTNKNDLDTKKDSKTNLAIAPLVSKQKLNTKTKTKVKTGKPFRVRGLGLPTTPHNVGRRVNPQ